MAHAALAMSAELNGHQLSCSASEETGMVLKASASEVTEDEWTKWVLGVVVRG